MSPSPAPNHNSTPRSSSSSSSSSFLSWLPLELRCRTVSFLHPADAVQFSNSLGSAEFGVTVSRLDPPQRIFARARWSGGGGGGASDDDDDGDRPVCSNYRLPVLPGGPVQSAVLSFRWRDQGFGERQGKLYVVATPSNEHFSNFNNSNNNNHDTTATANNDDDDAVSSLPFGGGRVVCETELAAHSMLPCEMVFVPRESSEVYTLWYRCGRSSRTGGPRAPPPPLRATIDPTPPLHQLFVEDCSIRLHVFDDPGRHWARNYRRLHALGAVGFPAQPPNSSSSSNNLHFLGAAAEDEGPRPPRDPFFPKLLLRVCQSLRRQLQAAAATSQRRGANGSAPAALDAELVEFMNEYGVPVTDISLRSVEEMVKADMEERSAFDKSQRMAREAHRARQEEQQRRNGGGGGGGGAARFAFGPFVGGNGEGGIMFGGGMGDLPEGLVQNLFGGGAAPGGGGGGRDGAFVDAQPMPAAMQNFIEQMMGAMGFDDDDDDEDEDDEEEEEEDDDEDEEEEEEEEEYLSDDEVIIVD